MRGPHRPPTTPIPTARRLPLPIPASRPGSFLQPSLANTQQFSRVSSPFQAPAPVRIITFFTFTDSPLESVPFHCYGLLGTLPIEALVPCALHLTPKPSPALHKLPSHSSSKIPLPIHHPSLPASAAASNTNRPLPYPPQQLSFQAVSSTNLAVRHHHWSITSSVILATAACLHACCAARLPTTVVVVVPHYPSFHLVDREDTIRRRHPPRSLGNPTSFCAA